MTIAFVALLGLIVGSFLNVCVRRIPLQESIVRPGSHCPQCKTPLAPYDNIPLLSFLALRGRCRHCRAPISWRYPLIEVLTSALFVAVLIRFGVTSEFVVGAAFVASMIVVTFIDLEHQIIPDVISLPGIVIGFGIALAGWGVPWRDSLIGILIGGGFLWAVAAGYYALTQREGMGGGDIKLLAMVGAFVGWQGVLLTLLLGSVTGTIAGVIVIISSGGDTKAPIPFGPFLAFGATVALLWGASIGDWYLGRMGF